MSRTIVNPYTGESLDYDKIPIYDPQSCRMGKFCPTTGHPLNDTAARSYSYHFGNDDSNKAIKASHDQALANVKDQLAQYPAVDESFDTPSPPASLKLVLTKPNASAVAAVSAAPVPAPSAPAGVSAVAGTPTK